MNISISDRSDIERLLRASPPWSLAHPARISVQIASVTEEEAKTIEERINRYADACGCGESGGLIVTVALAYGIYAFVTRAHSFGDVVLHSVIAFVAAGFAGKVVGMLRAKLRFRRSLRELAARMS
jgi:hypothetical protein